jgi:hypothetical protein
VWDKTAAPESFQLAFNTPFSEVIAQGLAKVTEAWMTEGAQRKYGHGFG